MSVHLVTAALDDGPLLAQMKLAVAPNDTETSQSNGFWALTSSIQRLSPLLLKTLCVEGLTSDGQIQAVCALLQAGLSVPRLTESQSAKNNPEDLDLTIKQRHNKQHRVSQPVGGKEHEYR